MARYVSLKSPRAGPILKSLNTPIAGDYWFVKISCVLGPEHGGLSFSFDLNEKINEVPRAVSLA